MEKRTFTASLWRAGDKVTLSTEFTADDSIQAVAIALNWASGHGFKLNKYGRRPKPDGKTYGGTVGPTQKDAFIQMYEIEALKIGKAT